MESHWIDTGGRAPARGRRGAMPRGGTFGEKKE